MTGETNPQSVTVPSDWQMLLRWIVVTLILLGFMLPLIAQAWKLAVEGAPLILYCTTVAAVALLALLHAPQIFYRLPKPAVAGVYIGLLVGLMLTGYTLERLDLAFEKTPAGAVQAAERVAREKAEAVEREVEAQRQSDLRQIEKTQEAVDKLESCFTMFGHRLPDLEEHLRDTLHNPSSFEHIETISIVPDAEGNTVVMRFRAENGFGALRTAYVKARVVPDTCEIQSIGEPE